ncbi:Xaa-Pro aminopeptidase [Arsukibacterium sp.]|uniref:Xaa-Pro aminopeptidase n=1 Tax=Arsukibacterium sp. TaxID=1977258 RepID=UPI002FDA307C
MSNSAFYAGMTLSADTFSQRRSRLLALMTPDSVALLPGATEKCRSRDTHYPFRQHSDFFYFTGFNEAEALLLLIKETDGAEHSLLLCQEKDPLAEVWHGRRAGPEQAAAELGLAAAPVSSLLLQLEQALQGKHTLYLNLGEFTELEQQLHLLCAKLRQAEKRGQSAPGNWQDLRPFTASLRLIKSAEEIAIMQQAADISVAAHHRAMRFSRPGRYEYQLEAEILHEFAMQGARHAAYNSIVGSGDNGCILHYTANSSELVAGQLVLIDAGCEYQGYAADISRTFAVNGRFSAEQAALYQLVLDTQLACIAAVKPGCSFALLNQLAEQKLTEGLVALGILQGELDELISSKACKQYFIHGIGHWLGLDVHDVGAYKVAGEDIAFAQGMVLTIEPGLYIPAGSPCAEQWWDLAVRIEDNILVTDTAQRNLTAGAVKTLQDITELMKDNG